MLFFPASGLLCRCAAIDAVFRAMIVILKWGHGMCVSPPFVLSLLRFPAGVADAIGAGGYLASLGQLRNSRLPALPLGRLVCSARFRLAVSRTAGASAPRRAQWMNEVHIIAPFVNPGALVSQIPGFGFLGLHNLRPLGFQQFFHRAFSPA